MIVESALQCLLPSWWELQVSLFAAAFVISAYFFFTAPADDPPDAILGLPDDKDKVSSRATEFLTLMVELRGGRLRGGKPPAEVAGGTDWGTIVGLGGVSTGVGSDQVHMRQKW
ncbi:hypothetical protein Leryth_025870 [Lithospermum erythrorhizon]|nr:hypothetical protein Leryth_025870 [Lithospermum erythrorhizon]